jgi:hypothetical protein
MFYALGRTHTDGAYLTRVRTRGSASIRGACAQSGDRLGDCRSATPRRNFEMDGKNNTGGGPAAA